MTHLDFPFQKRRYQSFVKSNFENGKTHWRKFLFLTPFGQTFQQFLNFLCLFMSSFSETFQENLNYASIRGGGGHLNVT